MPHAPREQFFDLVDRMVGDAGEDVAKIGFRVETVELCSFDERQDRRGTLATLVRSCEQPILAAERDRPDRPLGGIVVDLDGAVVEEAAERRLAGNRIADRLRRAA
jgi:hypothetical protein